MRFKFNESDKKWETYEPSENGSYSLVSSTNLPVVSDKPINAYPVGYGEIGEGGGVTHFILFTDGDYAYQLTLPIVSDPSEDNPELYEARRSEQAASLEEIINSVVLK